jgi:hypothetical protein
VEIKKKVKIKQQGQQQEISASTFNFLQVRNKSKETKR